MITALNITSAVAPGKGGMLPRRVSLHLTDDPSGPTPIATHMEALQDHSGKWARVWGHYFSAQDLDRAFDDYRQRCADLGVSMFNQGDQS